VKVGQTTGDVNLRVKAQDKTSNPEELILLKSWEVPGGVTDIDVHRELTSMGCERIRSGREWFKATIEEIEEAIERACSYAMSEEGFVKPTSSEVKLMSKAIEKKLGMRCLSTTSSCNISYPLGVAVRRKLEFGEDRGFVMLWPKEFSDLSKIEGRRETWTPVYDVAGVDMVFVTQRDFINGKEEE
jgi:hypothetical protein